MEYMSSEKTDVFSSLSNPIRRQILELLNKRGAVSYTELLEHTNLSSGPLYHHLRKLDAFIVQTDDKKYALNEQGEKAIGILRISEMDQISLQENEEITIFNLFGFSLVPLITFLSKKSYRTLFELIILFGVFGYLLNLNEILVLGNFIIPYRTNLVITYLSMILSWFTLGGLIELGARVIYKRKGNTSSLIIATGASFFPIWLFFIVIWSASMFIPTGIVISSILSLIMHSIFQIWSFMVMTTALGELKNLPLEKAALISLLVNYAQITLVLFILI